MASSSSFSAEDASDTSSASGASSVFDSETTDSEEERWKAEEEAREAAAARAVAYELQRAEVAAARNLRRAAPTVESSGEGSSQDSAPHMAADSMSDSSDLSVAQEGGETQPEAPAGDAKQSSSPEVSGDVALPASTQATIRRTVLSNVDYWACVRLIQAMGHTLRLPPMSLASLEEALVHPSKHNVMWRLTVQRLVQAVVGRRTWTDTTWHAPLVRILTDDAHDYLFEGLQETVGVPLEEGGWTWHATPTPMRLAILRALLEAQLLMHGKVKAVLSAMQACQEARDKYDAVVAAAGGLQAVAGKRKVASAVAALQDAETSVQAAVAAALPGGGAEGPFGLQGADGGDVQVMSGLTLGQGSFSALRRADHAAVVDGQGWAYMVLADHAGCVRVGRWRSETGEVLTSPLRAAQAATLASAYAPHTPQPTTTTASSASSVGTPPSPDSEAAAESAPEASAGAGAPAVDPSAKGTLLAFMTRPGSAGKGGARLPPSRAQAAPSSAAATPPQPSEREVERKLTRARRALLQRELMQVAVRVGLADATRLEYGPEHPGAFTAADRRDLVATVLLHHRGALPAWLRMELHGAVPPQLHGAGNVHCEVLAVGKEELLQLIGCLQGGEGDGEAVPKWAAALTPAQCTQLTSALQDAADQLRAAEAAAERRQRSLARQSRMLGGGDWWAAGRNRSATRRQPTPDDASTDSDAVPVGGRRRRRRDAAPTGSMDVSALAAFAYSGRSDSPRRTSKRRRAAASGPRNYSVSRAFADLDAALQ